MARKVIPCTMCAVQLKCGMIVKPNLDTFVLCSRFRVHVRHTGSSGYSPGARSRCTCPGRRSGCTCSVHSGKKSMMHVGIFRSSRTPSRRVEVSPGSRHHRRTYACRCLCRRSLRSMVSVSRTGRFGINGNRPMIPLVSMSCFCSQRTFRASLASRERPGSEKL